MTTRSSVLITGASSGIGATYAERFARRGHDLVLVARDQARLDALASRLRQESGVSVDVIQADLTKSADLSTVEARLRDDARIGILINNAGAALSGPFIGQAPEKECVVPAKQEVPEQILVTAGIELAHFRV